MPITQTLRVSDASHHLVASPPKQRLLFLSDEGSSGLLFNMILIIFKSSPLDPSSERKSVLAFVSKPLFFEPTQKVIKLHLGGALVNRPTRWNIDHLYFYISHPRYKEI